MTPDQMAKLTALLRNLARAMCHPPTAPGLLRDAADLDRAADLIESMAQRVPLSEEQVFADDGIMAANARIGIPLSEIMEIVRATESAHGIRSEK